MVDGQPVIVLGGTGVRDAARQSDAVFFETLVNQASPKRMDEGLAKGDSEIAKTAFLQDDFDKRLLSVSKHPTLGSSLTLQQQKRLVSYAGAHTVIAGRGPSDEMTGDQEIENVQFRGRL